MGTVDAMANGEVVLRDLQCLTQKRENNLIIFFQKKIIGFFK